MAEPAEVHAVKLVLMIVQAAQTIRHNRKTCRQLVHRVKMIGDLLKNPQLQASEMMQKPEVRKPLSELEEVLREAYALVVACQNSNCMYHFFMGGKLANQFHAVQDKISYYLQVFPIISHIDNAERLDHILNIVRSRQSKAVEEVPRLLSSCSNFSATSCSTPDNRVAVLGKFESFSKTLYCVGSLKLNIFQLLDATNNFSSENKIGQGSFGCVYKGQLCGGLEVAIKRCFEGPCSPSQIDFQDLQFGNEICFLPKLQHTNIIKLLGYCIQGTERILVYEYISNGSLDAFIFGGRTGRLYLDWPARSRITKGIAEGLVYLHKQCGLYIIHGDLKPSNILLDANMNPKISDFGMARMYNPNVGEEYADRIVGSIGFIAPECRARRHFSIKSDVYGFGALLLEAISGTRCFSLATGDSADDFGFLNKRAWHLWRTGRLAKLCDSSLRDERDESQTREITRCIHIALLCVQENPANRPTMQEVVMMLNCQNVSLPTPQPPAYLRIEMVHANTFN